MAYTPRRLAAILALSCALGGAPAARAEEPSGLEASRLTLPKGPGSIEGLGDNADVDVNMGLMSYRVSIDIPAGHGTDAPALRLAYSSGSGASVAGVGWSLDIPTIERQTSRGLPRYDREDVFVVDGGQELVRLPPTGHVYRARFESRFVRYSWVAAGDGREGYWRAEYPDGRVGFFGAEPSGALVPEARVSGPDGTFRYHLVATIDVHGHELRYRYQRDGQVALARAIEYVFRGPTPRYAVELEYEARPDHIIDAKPGFELRLTRRLSAIRVRVRGEQLRRYALAYEDSATSGGLSRLAEVVRYGASDRTPYPVRFSFRYSAATPDRCASLECEPRLVSMGSVPVDVRTGDADLVDLDGDAMPDLVDTGGTTHLVRLNQWTPTSHGFDAPLESAVAVGGAARLSSPAVQLVDLDGDGFVDLLDGANGRVLWNRGLDSGDWVEATSVTDLGLPDFAADTNLRFFDYDHDGRIDVMHASDAGTWFYLNDGRTFDTTIVLGDPIGVGFEGGLRLSDMNGDGLQDAVTVSDGLVRYRPYLGFGRWGAWTEVAGAPLVLPPSGVELADVNGDGLSDLLAVEASEVQFWLNRNAEELDGVRTVRRPGGALLPVRTAEVSVRLVDMNGNGSVDVVWFQPGGAIAYLELFPRRPHLLERIENGIGRVTEIEYGSSAEHMARDRVSAPWSHRLPHAMLTVDRVVDRELLSGVSEVREYRYRDGFYDGVERQFRGFAHVEVRTSGDEHSEPGRRIHVFDVGVEDVHRKGLLVELTSTSGPASADRVLDVERHTYEACPLEGVPADTVPPVRWMCERRMERQVREGAPPSEWRLLREDYGYDGWGNRTSTARLGVVGTGPDGSGACRSCGGRPSDVFGEPCDAECRGDELYETREMVTPETGTGGRWLLRLPAVVRRFGAPGGPTSEERHHYDGEPFVGLPLRSATRGLLTRVSVRERADGSRFVDRERYRHDAHGNVVAARDPNGNLRTFGYDEDGVLAVRESVVMDAPSRTTPYALQMRVEHGTPIESPVLSIDWHLESQEVSARLDRATRYDYDEFGRLRAIARPGDSLELPTEQFVYELDAPLSRIVRRARSGSGGAIDVEEIQCFDGRGRARQTRSLIEPGSYQVSGFQAYDARGQVGREHQPYRSSTGACDRRAPDVLFTETRRDARGRAVGTTLPDATERGGVASETREVYAPLAVSSWDPEDLDPASAHAGTPSTLVRDGLDRIVRIERRMSSTGQPLTLEVRYDGLGHLRGYVDAQGYERIQQHDLLGRVLSVQDVDSGLTTYEYDDAGNLLARTDARGVTTDYAYDEANRIQARWDRADPLGSRATYHYDAATRCDPGVCRFTEGRLAAVDYPLDGDEPGADANGYDARGNLVHQARVLDGFRFEHGTVFDNLSRPVGRRFPRGLSIDYELDGLGRVRRVGEHVPAVRFDERGDMVRIELGNGAVTEYSYDARRQLASIETTLPSGERLQDYRYARDRAGNILEVDDRAPAPGYPGQGAIHTYDALYRLTSSRLDPGRPDFDETLTFTYDDGDNILSMVSSLGPESPGHVGEYTYDPARPHAVSRAGEVSYEYDAAGHATRRADLELVWDHEGRLSRAVGPSGSESYAYGGDSRRVVRRSDGAVAYELAPDVQLRDGVMLVGVRVGTRIVAYILGGAQEWTRDADLAPLTESAGHPTPRPDGAVRASDAWVVAALQAGIWRAPEFLSDVAVDSVLARAVAATLSDGVDVIYTLYDHVGGGVLEMSASDVTLRRACLPFGGLRSSPTRTWDASVEFAGLQRDELSGFLYAGTRYYDGLTGRWTSPDEMFARTDGVPTWEAVGRYAYVRNAPTGLVDPMGTTSESADPTGYQRLARDFYAVASGIYEVESAGAERVAGGGLASFARSVVEGSLKAGSGMAGMVAIIAGGGSQSLHELKASIDPADNPRLHTALDIGEAFLSDVSTELDAARERLGSADLIALGESAAVAAGADERVVTILGNAARLGEALSSASEANSAVDLAKGLVDTVDAERTFLQSLGRDQQR